MKSIFYLVIIIILAIMFVISNFIGLLTSPIHSIFNLALICCIIALSVIYGEQKEKERFEEGEYNYDQENPNALVTGYLAGGTVYASYPENSPGLGWIL